MDVNDLISQPRTKTALGRLSTAECEAVFRVMGVLGYEVVRNGRVPAKE